MRFYALTYPNHTTLVVKSDEAIGGVLSMLHKAKGISAMGGAIYNPQLFLTLSWITDPDKRQQLVAQELNKVLIG